MASLHTILLLSGLQLSLGMNVNLPLHATWAGKCFFSEFHKFKFKEA